MNHPAITGTTESIALAWAWSTAKPAVSDFNGDGTSDIPWYNAASSADATFRIAGAPDGTKQPRGTAPGAFSTPQVVPYGDTAQMKTH